MTSKSRSQKNVAKNSRSNMSKMQSRSNNTSASGKKQKSLKDLLDDNLKDVYSAEKQMVEAFPEIVEAAFNSELRDALKHHLEQTKKHVTRLEKVFERFQIDINEVETCEAMKGLIAECKKVVEEYEESHVRDSALIIAAQKIEHYEIAAYGSLCELSDVLGYNNLNDFLGRSLDDEESTDEELTEIAMIINDKALESSEEELEEFDEEKLS